MASKLMTVFQWHTNVGNGKVYVYILHEVGVGGWGLGIQRRLAQVNRKVVRLS